MEIHIATHLMLFDGEYRFNAVYAFKSKTSVKSYEKYLESTDEDHKLIATPCSVPEGTKNISVITEFDVDGDTTEYKSTKVFDDYEDARDYVANIKENNPGIKIEHETVKVHSRFSPDILHCGWAFL